MAVRVRMFAALREAAGTSEATLPPGPLPALLDALRERYGERFAQVLGLCTVLVDGSAVSREAQIAVPDNAELALLPPVSGGADSPAALPNRLSTPPAVAVPLACLAIALGALAAGRAAFTVALLGLAAVALVDLAVLLDRGIARPVLAVAAIPALVLPVAIAVDQRVGWSDLSAWFAGAVLTLFLSLFLTGRRWGAIDVLGVTVLAMLVVGLGTSSLLLLRAEPNGLRLVALVVAMVATVEAVWPRAAVVPLAAAAIAIAGVLSGTASALALAVLPVAAGVSVAAARGLLAELRKEGRLEPRRTTLPRAVAGDGLTFGALAATLLAAPVALILSRAAV